MKAGDTGGKEAEAPAGERQAEDGGLGAGGDTGTSRRFRPNMEKRAEAGKSGRKKWHVVELWKKNSGWSYSSSLPVLFTAY